MRQTLLRLCALSGLTLLLLGPITRPASAITVELARKCRLLAVTAYPTQIAGTLPYAAKQRAFFSDCVAKNGNIELPKTEATKPATPPTTAH